MPSANWWHFLKISTFENYPFSLSKMLGLKSDPILGTTWTNCPPRSLFFILWRLGVVAHCRCPSVLRPGVLMAQGSKEKMRRKKSDPCDPDSGLKKRMLDPRGCFVLGSLFILQNHHWHGKITIWDQIFWKESTMSPISEWSKACRYRLFQYKGVSVYLGFEKRWCGLESFYSGLSWFITIWYSDVFGSLAWIGRSSRLVSG